LELKDLKIRPIPLDGSLLGLTYSTRNDIIHDVETYMRSGCIHEKNPEDYDVSGKGTG
jgi:hypothetical protein